MKDLIEVLAEIEKEQRKYFKNYKRYAEEIKKIVKDSLKDAEVFVFGSEPPERCPSCDHSRSFYQVKCEEY